MLDSLAAPFRRPMRRCVVSGCALLLVLLASCHKAKDVESNKNDDSVSSAVEVPAAPAAEVPAAATEPLQPALLDQFAPACVLVQVPGQPNCQGLLLDEVKVTSMGREYLVLCGPPGEPETIRVAYRIAGGLGVGSARKKAALPSGLAIYSLVTQSMLVCARQGPAEAGETYHALRVVGKGAHTADQRAALESQLADVRAQINQNQSRLAATNAMSREQSRRPGGYNSSYHGPQGSLYAAEASRLAGEEARLDATLHFSIRELAIAELAAADSREKLPQAEGALNDSLLATSVNTVQAIRHHGKWIDLQDVRTAVADQIGVVTLKVSNSQSNIDLTCDLESLLPMGASTFSAVAVTTYELESLGSGTLAERLAKAPSIPFEGKQTLWRIARQLPWNGKRTTLWLKVFNDKKPDKLLLDEEILLSDSESFSARWGKPPSPLIVRQAAVADVPANLVKEKTILHAKGAIRDLVAAGDGSILMVQTDSAPYWAALDLKTGQWLTPPWKATADTLLASQAGNIYLIDRKTHVLEIRELASGKRLGMQLLPLEGSIVAVAAPLNAADQPLLIATDKEVMLLDSKKFEVISSGLDVRPYVESAEAGGTSTQKLDLATAWLRASHDGTLYSLSGTTAKVTSPRLMSVLVTTDPNGCIIAQKSDGYMMIPSRGRYQARSYPDHGGSGREFVVASSPGNFPDTFAKICFVDPSSNIMDATLNDPPVLPSKTEIPNIYPLPDRGVYCDRANGVLLLPDGDKLHLLRLNLPAADPTFPNFVLPGEPVEIPLPPGSDHKLMSSVGGDVRIGKSTIRWIAPPACHPREYREALIKLEWTGELGSRIVRSYTVKLAQPQAVAMMESADGSRKKPLARRRVIAVGADVRGFAGSGYAMLTGDHNLLEAWNLCSGEKIFSQPVRSGKFLGDADRLYVLHAQGGKLASFDLHTGEALGEESRQGLAEITTGMASRMPLLAVEREGHRPYLTQIHQDTLKSYINDLPADTQQQFYNPDFKTNASGSATWTRSALIVRDKKVTTVKTFNGIQVGDGCPDASGRYIVGNNHIVDLGVTPPKERRLSELPGVSDSVTASLDESGRYLMLIESNRKPTEVMVSLRDVAEPAKELFKLWLPSRPHLISNTKTLVCRLIDNQRNRQMGIAVYDLDIPAVVKEFSQ